MEQIKQRIREKVYELIRKVNAEQLCGGGKQVSFPEIKFEYRKNTMAGYFKYNIAGDSVIFFNMYYLEEYPEYMINQTVPHEVAHYVVWDICDKDCFTRGRNNAPHGRYWKYMMRFFGVEANRCHELKTPDKIKKNKQTFVYTCGCSSHELSKVRHNSIQTGKHRYICKACKSVIIYEESKQ